MKNEESKYEGKGMYKGAPRISFEQAKELRENMTQAELILWAYIRKNALGVKFRRQHPISIYIVDFYCHKENLVIEVDGEYHNSPDQKQKDEQRTTDLKELGLKVIRFNNEEILHNINDVLTKIKSYIKTHPSKRKPL